MNPEIVGMSPRCISCAGCVELFWVPYGWIAFAAALILWW